MVPSRKGQSAQDWEQPSGCYCHLHQRAWSVRLLSRPQLLEAAPAFVGQIQLPGEHPSQCLWTDRQAAAKITETDTCLLLEDTAVPSPALLHRSWQCRCDWKRCSMSRGCSYNSLRAPFPNLANNPGKYFQYLDWMPLKKSSPRGGQFHSLGNRSVTLFHRCPGEGLCKRSSFGHKPRLNPKQTCRHRCGRKGPRPLSKTNSRGVGHGALGRGSPVASETGCQP